MTQKVGTGPLGAKLQVTKGYYLDFDRLARLLSAACADRRGKIPINELAEEAGLPATHVENLGSLAQALGLITKQTYKPTIVGRLLQANDPFFDDMGTLWFLHYTVASDPRNLVWNRVVNQAAASGRNFTRENAQAEFADLGGVVSDFSHKNHVRKEVNSVLDAYTNQHFSRLAYLRADGDKYQLGYREAVPPLVLAACIVLYRDRHRPGDTALSIADILSAPNSPGVVLALDEGRLRAGLEQLKAEPGLSLESRADLDQVRITSDAPTHAWMERYYAAR